uniref:hypothetical protein n=1 Tax=Paenibacillus chitinolyticus TaxID=79263 RepID=UPI0036705E4D
MHAMAEQGRTDFNDLLRERRAELGISLRELETRSVHPESGTQAKFGWLSKVENGDLTTRLIVARVEEMSEEDRRQLAEIAETFARRKRSSSEG